MSLQDKIDEVRAAFEALSHELRYAPKRLERAIDALDAPEPGPLNRMPFMSMAEAAGLTAADMTAVVTTDDLIK